MTLLATYRIGNCQSGSWKGVEKTLTLASEAIPSDCASWTNYAQKACSFPLQKQIQFTQEFESPPSIQVVAVSLWTDLTPCISRILGPSGYYESGQATDTQLAFASNITTTGFTLRAGSSPENGVWSCGGDSSVYNYWIPNVVRWVATGKKKNT